MRPAPVNQSVRRIGRKQMKCKKIMVCKVVVLISFFFCLIQTAAGENKTENSRETISALHELYNAEIMASKTYLEFAKKDEEEKYYSISRLFITLSGSETVHARNFKTILNDMGVDPNDMGVDPEIPPNADIKIADTKTNLKWAIKVELTEIDTNYPTLIKKIKPEGNKRALEDITYAWKSEMQHKDLIKKMKSALGFFFMKVIDKLKEAKDYHVCQRCGSTVFKLPEKSCIICGSPVSMYKQIK
jgi:rubrerythrin